MKQEVSFRRLKEPDNTEKEALKVTLVLQWFKTFLHIDKPRMNPGMERNWIRKRIPTIYLTLKLSKNLKNIVIRTLF